MCFDLPSFRDKNVDIITADPEAQLRDLGSFHFSPLLFSSVPSSLCKWG
jgi:hypothetical protein